MYVYFETKFGPNMLRMTYPNAILFVFAQGSGQRNITPRRLLLKGSYEIIPHKNKVFSIRIHMFDYEILYSLLCESTRPALYRTLVVLSVPGFKDSHLIRYECNYERIFLDVSYFGMWTRSN